MIECRGFPAGLRMTRCALVASLGMDWRRRCTVAGGALAAYFWPQQVVRKALRCPFDQLWAGVVAMAGGAVWLGQRLMKSDCVAFLRYRLTRRCSDADVSDLVTSGAAIGGDALEWDMAGKAVAGDAMMRWNKGARCDHQLRPEERKSDQSAKIDDDKPKTPAAHYFHPQNRKVAMMCASASTQNASVIGRWTTRQALTASKVRLSQ